jgi:hypothetical protein
MRASEVLTALILHFCISTKGSASRSGHPARVETLYALNRRLDGPQSRIDASGEFNLLPLLDSNRFHSDIHLLAQSVHRMRNAVSSKDTQQ